MPNVYIPAPTVTLVDQTCGECGIVFAWPQAFRKERIRDRQTWYCPNGHGRHFAGDTGDTEANRLRDELAREKHRTEQAQSEAKDLRLRLTAKDRQLSVRKGQITRIKNRVANGVCPCCNRSFTNLHRHMTTQHPAWKPELEVTLPSSDLTKERT